MPLYVLVVADPKLFSILHELVDNTVDFLLELAYLDSKARLVLYFCKK